MRRLSVSFLICAILMAQPLLATEKPAISLPRIAKWEMKYQEDDCSLLALFAKGDDSVVMAITRTTPGDWFEMRLYGKMLGYGEINMPIEIAFDSGLPLKRTALSATTGTKKKVAAAIISDLRVDGFEPDPKMGPNFPVPTVSADQEAKVASITFKPAGKGRYRLETGSMGPPLAAMRTCTDNLLRHWGFDPLVEAKLSRRAMPAGNPAKWLGSNDFPQHALEQGMNGYLRFRLDVDPEGKVAGCRILYRTNPDEFADTSCKLLSQRGRFQPALDAAGKRVKSYYVNTVKWVSRG